MHCEQRHRPQISRTQQLEQYIFIHPFLILPSALSVLPSALPNLLLLPKCGFLSRVDREFGIFQHMAPTMRLLFEFPHETGLIRRFAGNVGTELNSVLVAILRTF